MKPNSKKMYTINLEQTNLVSEESFDGLGWYPRENTYYSVNKGVVYNTANPTSFGGIQVQISSDKTQHLRAIYSGLDFLGDIGGLYSIFIDIGGLFLSVISWMFGDPLQ